MAVAIQLVFACLLFLMALRLSALFSGSETGFYRASFLRITIDAQAGDPAAQRLLWFARNPTAFVTTILVGNNVVNYLTTVAMGLAVFTLFPQQASSMEIVGTLLIAPVVFICGELLPKSLYYRAPLQLLRRDAALLMVFYYLLLPVSFPLFMISKLFEKLGGGREDRAGLALGRNRLVQVLSQGHREGLLTEVQTRLVHGLMHTAGQSVRGSTTPSDRVLGVPDTTPRKEILSYARKFGISIVPVRAPDDPHGWYGYLRVGDLAITRRKVSALILPMPRISASLTKLETLLQLRESDMACGVVMDGETVVGVISAHGLVEQLFRPPHAPNQLLG